MDLDGFKTHPSIISVRSPWGVHPMRYRDSIGYRFQSIGC